MDIQYSFDLLQAQFNNFHKKTLKGIPGMQLTNKKVVYAVGLESDFLIIFFLSFNKFFRDKNKLSKQK